jgi:cell division protein FtsQ
MSRGSATRRRGAQRRRRLLAAVVVVVALAAGYLFWLRDSSLVEVNDVEVTGVTANAEQVRSALTAEAETMTTLNVDRDALLGAVERFPTVRGMETDTAFPHGLKIEVSERLPVAVVSSSDEEVPVSSDGYLLEGVEFDAAGLPLLELAEEPEGGRLSGEDAALAAIAGGVHDRLRPQVETIVLDEEAGGVVAVLEGGMDLRFGDSDRAAAKWAAAATVLSDPELGATGYVDVSVPERPVAGS